MVFEPFGRCYKVFILKKKLKMFKLNILIVLEENTLNLMKNLLKLF